MAKATSSNKPGNQAPRREITQASERLALAFERLESLLKLHQKQDSGALHGQLRDMQQQHSHLAEEHAQLLHEHRDTKDKLQAACDALGGSITRVEQILKQAS